MSVNMENKSSDDDAGEDENAHLTSDRTPPKKKIKRLCRYKQSWEKDFEWYRKVPGNEFKACCTLCRREFSIGHGGLHDVSTHNKSELHLRAVDAARSSSVRSFFVRTSPAGVDRQAVAAEVTRIYHAVKHHVSYNAADCGAKLDSLTFPDSAIARKTACGRTKAESIVTSVLAPKSVESITRDLTSGDDLQPSCFAVSTDASNWKNRKMFPICVQYFTVESGVSKKLLDFVEQNDEHSVPVAALITKSLSSHSLDIKNVSAYSADNALW